MSADRIERRWITEALRVTPGRWIPRWRDERASVPLGDLRSHLARRGGVWEALSEGRNVRAAINQEMVGPDVAVNDRDEIAFFPPVTGG